MNKNYMYDYELFKQGKYYIRLETQEKYDKVMKELDEFCIKWVGSIPLDFYNFWDNCKTKTAIRCIGGSLSYSEYHGYSNMGCIELLPTDYETYEKYNGHYDKLDTFTVMRSRSKDSPLDPYEFALSFNINKYNERIGKKDDKLKELNKIKSYVDEWIDYLKEKGEIE